MIGRHVRRPRAGLLEDRHDTASSSRNTIGGTTPAARNVISVSQAGVSILIDSSENVVAGNFSGVDTAGTATPGNASHGGVVAFHQGYRPGSC